ncbi:MAG TPA: hypothetical protein VGC97_10265 [Pyrinomonadaceae bacterium]
MRLKFLFLTLIFGLTASFSMAQEKGFVYPIEFSISVKETKIPASDKSVLFNLKITNNLASAVNTQQFDKIAVKLAKNWDKKKSDETETAFFRLERKIINAGESFETEIDLKKISWSDKLSSDYSDYFDTDSLNRFKYTPFLSGTYFLSVTAGNCREALPENSITLVIRRECESNRIMLDFQPPALKVQKEEENPALQISLKDAAIQTKSENVPVKIKVTNKSKQILNTEDLGTLFLYFSKCREEMCYRSQDLLYAVVGIKSQKLRANESIEFESNLSDLIWNDNLSSNDIGEKIYKIPKENIYFYAAIPTRKNVLPDGVRLPEDFLSNQITVSLN